MILLNSYHLKKIYDFTKEFTNSYELVINNELSEFWNLEDGLICQKCSDILVLPFYFCKDGIRCYCKNCVFGEKNICNFELYKDHHEHYRIIKISVQDNKENDTTNN